MTTEFLQLVIARDLAALREEIRAYPEEDALWACPQGIANSAGTLALHLTGNLQHFIGAQLGGTGYVRDREAEFADRSVPRSELEARIEATIRVVRQTFERLDDGNLSQQYPLAVGGTRLATGLFLTHLAAHLAFHLGQVDYHRRVVTGQSAGIGAQSISRLVSERRDG
jgi:hypothetical protein